MESDGLLRSEKDARRRTHKGWIHPFEPIVSVSNLGNNVAIVRFASESTEDGYKLLSEILAPLCGGALHELPRPYADRINCLASTSLTASAASTDQGVKRSINEVNNAAPRMRGREECTAVAALRQYDESIIAIQPNSVSAGEGRELNALQRK